MNKIFRIIGYTFAGLLALVVIFIGYIFLIAEPARDKSGKTYLECLNEGYDRADMTHGDHKNSESWNGAYKSYTRDCMIRQGYPSGKPY